MNPVFLLHHVYSWVSVKHLWDELDLKVLSVAPESHMQQSSMPCVSWHRTLVTIIKLSTVCATLAMSVLARRLTLTNLARLTTSRYPGVVVMFWQCVCNNINIHTTFIYGFVLIFNKKNKNKNLVNYLLYLVH